MEQETAGAPACGPYHVMHTWRVLPRQGLRRSDKGENRDAWSRIPLQQPAVEMIPQNTWRHASMTTPAPPRSLRCTS